MPTCRVCGETIDTLNGLVCPVGHVQVPSDAGKQTLPPYTTQDLLRDVRMPGESSKGDTDTVTPESVKRALERLIRDGYSRKVIVNVGPGRIQSAHVEHREAIKP
jgi:hypothetical protein